MREPKIFFAAFMTATYLFQNLNVNISDLGINHEPDILLIYT